VLQREDPERRWLGEITTDVVEIVNGTVVITLWGLNSVTSSTMGGIAMCFPRHRSIYTPRNLLTSKKPPLPRVRVS
jgi:hypothetical protein